MKVRKWIFRIALALGGVALLGLGVHQLYPVPGLKISGFRAVPKYSAFLMELSSFRQAVSPWDAWKLSDNWLTLREIETSFLDTIAAGEPFGRVLALLQPMNKAEMGWAGIWEASNALECLDRWLALHPVETSRYMGVEINAGRTAEGRSFAVARFRNLIFAAPYPFLVEDLIREVNRVSLRRLPFSPGNAGRIAVQPSQVAPQWTNALTEQGRRSWELFRNWTGWAVVEPVRDSAGWAASGKWVPGSDSTWLNRLLDVGPAAPDPVFSILPEQTLACVWSAPTGNTWWSSGPGRRLLKPWWTGEWAAGLLPGFGGETGASPFWVGKIQSQEAFNAWLGQWASEQGELPGQAYQTFEIRRIMSEAVLPLPWTGRPAPIRNPYIVELEGYVVFTESKPALEVWLDQYLAGQVLARADFFLEGRSRLPRQAVVWAYLQSDRFGRLVEETFQPRQPLPLLKSGHVQFALSPAGKVFQLEAVGRAQEVFSSAITIAWKANLSAPAAIAPRPVFDGEEYCWMAQDTEYGLYRIGRGGEVVWRRPLQGKVLSDFFPMSYYSSQPKEMLFNTADGIYLLDEQGQVVSTYPLRLLSPATNGLLLTDFSGRGDYGVFVACENRRLYGFDRYGRPLEGWNPGPEVGTVIQPMQHFQFGGKDFLVAYSQEGVVHVMQRDGTYRFPPVKAIGPVTAPPGVQALPQSARIALGETSGKVQVISAEGAAFTLSTPVGTNEWVDFCFEDVRGDERKDYVVMSGKEVAVYYYEGEEFKAGPKTKLENEQDELVAGKGYYGTVDGDKKQIFLFDKEGKIVPGFPLAGTSAFTIVALPEGRLLVAALDADVYAYWLP
jgi:hypothetical protein